MDEGTEETRIGYAELCAFLSRERGVWAKWQLTLTTHMVGMNGGIASRLLKWVPVEPSVRKCSP